MLPCVGNDAFKQEETGKRSNKKAATPAALVTAVEVYSIPSLRLLVLQQRSPTILGRSAAYVAELTAFARQIGVARLVLLTSSMAFRQLEEDLDAIHPISFFLAQTDSDQTKQLQTTLRDTLQWNSLHFHSLEQDELPLRLDQLNSAEEADDLSMRVPTASATRLNPSDPADPALDAAIRPIIPVPGLGITRALYEAATAAPAPSSSSASLPATLFLHSYVNEGANDRDAMVMAQCVYTMLYILAGGGEPVAPSPAAQTDSMPVSGENKLVDPREMMAAWRPPPSWSALFGNEPDESMYL